MKKEEPIRKSVAIIGSGPAALMLAAELNKNKFDCIVYEKNTAPARKFLVAGEGGLNLTHSEPMASFISRYTPSGFLDAALLKFGNNDLGNWFDKIGIETFVGSSKRVFPNEQLKPVTVLNAILKKVRFNDVEIKTGIEWKGWDNHNNLIFQQNKKLQVVHADIVVYCLGGGSWPVTGSDGSWLQLFKSKGLEVLPFESSNCAFQVAWPESFMESAEGQPLKNISVFCNGKEKKGELVITRFGIEGGAIYAMSPEIRKQLREKNEAEIYIDLKPGTSELSLSKTLKPSPKKSMTQILQNEIRLSKTQIDLLKTQLNKEEFVSPQLLARAIKHLKLKLIGTAPLEEAISSVGGIALGEVTENFEFKKMPGHYAIGEMLDWDAPTGGYLLQACFSMGYYLASQLNNDGKE